MKLFNAKVSFNVDVESFTKLNLRPFWIGFIVVVIFQFFTMLGLKPDLQFMSPLPVKKEVFDSVKPKLQAKMNEFTLKKPNPLIHEAHAAGQYDKAASYVVINLDSGDVIAQKNTDEQVPIASLTKIMSSVVALDLAGPDELFTVTQKAADKIPTKIGVVPGQKLKLEELLNAALLTSANDAVEVIKDGVDTKYGEAVFVKAMNEKAKILRLKHTHFDNPQGFDSKENYSSAEDLALLSQYALTKYPLIASITKKDYEFLGANENHKQYDLYNWNGLLGVYPNVFGVKIGNTPDAGTTTVVAAERSGKKILVVLLGAPTMLERDLWAGQLLDVGFENEGLSAIKVTEAQLKTKYATWKFWN